MGNGESGIGNRADQANPRVANGRISVTWTGWQRPRDARSVPRSFTIPDSLFPIPETGGLPRTDGTPLTAPHAFTAMQSARYTSPASRRRPPAFIGPRRAKESCGVGAFSLNYGPQTTRGKSPYASDPRHHASSGTRDPNRPAHFRTKAITVPQAFDMLKYRCGPDSSLSNAPLLLTRTTFVSVAGERHYCCVLQRRPRFA